MFLQILCLIWTEKHGNERVSLISNFLAFPSLTQNSVTPVEVRTLQVLTRATKSAIPSSQCSHSLPTFLCSVWSMLDILKRRYWEVQPCPTTCSYLGCWDVGFWSEMWSLRSWEAWHDMKGPTLGFWICGLWTLFDMTRCVYDKDRMSALRSCVRYVQPPTWSDFPTSLICG